MQRNEALLEMALDLYRAGIEQDNQVLLITAGCLIEKGWTKGIAIENPIEAIYPVAAEGESELPDPNLARSPSAEAKMQPTDSARALSDGGIQWGSHWLNPNNVDVPDRGMQRVWAGWRLNDNQKWVMQYFCGEKGHYTLGVQAVIAYIKKNGGKGKGGERKHIKPHYLMHSMSRRGLVTEIDKDVWILTPRGQMYVRTVLKQEPTEKADGIHSVA
jgi:hypothetical protein